MWEIHNHTPFATAGAFQRDHTGRTLWCVWIKATFTLRNGRPVLFTSQQTPLFQGPVFTDDNPEKALIHDADITLPKPRVDLTIIANAPATDTVLPVTAKLGPWEKTLHVHPAAKWHRWMGAVAMDPAPTDPVSLGWDSASGGPDNPVGKGTYTDRGDALDQPCAQLFYPDDHQTKPTKPARPASFAPIARQWPTRAQHAGTYDAAWERTRAPILPADLDPRYWQSAPEDQTLDRTQVAGQALRLTNMGWTGADTCETNVPDLQFDISVMFKRRWSPVVADLQTVALDLPAQTMALTYMVAYPISAAQNDVHVDQTYIALPKTTGFSVAAADAHRFASAQVEEPA